MKNDWLPETMKTTLRQELITWSEAKLNEQKLIASKLTAIGPEVVALIDEELDRREELTEKPVPAIIRENDLKRTMAVIEGMRLRTSAYRGQWDQLWHARRALEYATGKLSYDEFIHEFSIDSEVVAQAEQAYDLAAVKHVDIAPRRRVGP